MNAMSSKARIFGQSRALVYAVHDARSPSDEEWSVYLANVRTALTSIPDPSLAVGMAITDGGAPNARQRRQVVQVVQEVAGETMSRVRSSVVSDSALVRGVVTALSWHIPEIRIFAPAKIGPALEHVRLRASDVDTLIADLEELAKPLQHARTARAVIDLLRMRTSARGA